MRYRVSFSVLVSTRIASRSLVDYFWDASQVWGKVPVSEGLISAGRRSSVASWVICIFVRGSRGWGVWHGTSGLILTFVMLLVFLVVFLVLCMYE